MSFHRGAVFCAVHRASDSVSCDAEMIHKSLALYSAAHVRLYWQSQITAASAVNCETKQKTTQVPQTVRSGFVAIYDHVLNPVPRIHCSNQNCAFNMPGC